MKLPAKVLREFSYQIQQFIVTRQTEVEKRTKFWRKLRRVRCSRARTLGSRDRSLFAVKSNAYRDNLAALNSNTAIWTTQQTRFVGEIHTCSSATSSTSSRDGKWLFVKSTSTTAEDPIVKVSLSFYNQQQIKLESDHDKLAATDVINVQIKLITIETTCTPIDVSRISNEDCRCHIIICTLSWSWYIEIKRDTESNFVI